MKTTVSELRTSTFDATLRRSVVKSTVDLTTLLRDIFPNCQLACKTKRRSR